jgi:flagella synthesis protein FlgN
MTITVRTLIECLQQDDKDLKQLEAVLKKENEALRTRDLKVMEDVLKIKTSLLSAIEQRAKHKTDILIALGFQPQRMTLDIFLSQLNNDPLKRVWAYLRQKLQDCKTLNSINGKVVSHSQIRVNKMMQIVRGQNTQAGLYTATGKQSSASCAYRIASA